MEASEFQKKLSDLLLYAESKEKRVSSEEVKRFFLEAGLSKEQTDRIFQYLRIKGIEVTLDGPSDPVADEFIIDAEKPEIEKLKTKKPETAETSGQEENLIRELSYEDQEYLDEYLGRLPATGSPADRQALFDRLNQGDTSVIHTLTDQFLRTAAEMAVRMKTENILLPDLIQEANLGLFEALSDMEYREKNEHWLRTRILAGIHRAVREQELSMDADRALVDRVEKLEASIRDLMDEDDEDLKFSVGELAVILDMEEDEIRDILRLTGDNTES